MRERSSKEVQEVVLNDPAPSVSLVIPRRGRRDTELHGNFLETCCLLLYGELPTPAEKLVFDRTIARHTMIHEQMAWFYQGFRRDAHPMAVMVGCVGALSAFYHDSTDISDPHQRMIASFRLIAKMPTIAAMAYKYTIGQSFIYPKNDIDYGMCFAVPRERYEVNPLLARAMDRIFILCADTSRTPRPQRFGSPARPVPIRSPASRQASPACGVGPTRRS